MMRIAIVCALAGCVSAPDRPPPQGIKRKWTRRKDFEPGDLRSPRLAYDSRRERVVLYGGWEVTQADAMYELTPDGWSKLCDPCLGAANAAGMGGRNLAGFAYDRSGDRFVLFGGQDAMMNPSNDIWEYRDGAWSYDGAAPVEPRTMAQLVFDAELGGMRMVGGYSATGAMGDAWTFVNGTWSQDPDPPAGEFSSQGMASTYDRDHDRVLVLEDPGTADSDRVWQHTSDGWSLLCDSCTGTPRHGASIVHIPKYDQTFIIGGDSLSTPMFQGTWVLVDDHFEGLDTFHDVPYKTEAGVAYDESRDVVELYGGFGCTNGDAGQPPAACAETWELVSDVPSG